MQRMEFEIGVIFIHWINIPQLQAQFKRYFPPKISVCQLKYLESLKSFQWRLIWLFGKLDKR